MATTRRQHRADLVRRDAAPLASRPPVADDLERPDFDFTDMCVGFLFAANLSGGNVPGAALTAAGFVVQKAVRRGMQQHAQATGRDGLSGVVGWLAGSVDHALGALPNPDDWRLFWQMPARQKMQFIATGELPAGVAQAAARPDEVGDDNRDGAAEGRTVRLDAPAASAPRRRTVPASAEDVAQERGTQLLERPLYDNDPTAAWGPTILAAQPRWGKSQVQIARLVNDIEAGHEAVWMSTHLTLYHPKDQPTDLRPIADHFEQIGEAKAIRDRLHYYVDTVLEERLGKYRRGEDVGHPIALHIGEWPALVAEFGEDISAPMRRLIREAPKTQVIVSTLDAQDAHVQTLGLGSGVRANFWTKLVGRVDERTWEVLVGPDVPYQQLPSRTWYAPGVGLVRFPLPDAGRIRKIAGVVEQPAEVAAPATAPTGMISREELLRLAPTLARKKGYVPTAEDTSALAGMLGLDEPPPAQSVTVDEGPRQVIVNVQQTTGRSTTARRRGGFDAQARRQRADKYRVVLDAVRKHPTIGLNELRRQLGGDRNRLSEDWNRARRELGIEK